MPVARAALALEEAGCVVGRLVLDDGTHPVVVVPDLKGGCRNDHVCVAYALIL